MFPEFGIKDFIDIFLVALLLFYIYRLMKESRSMNVFIGILVFVLIWLLVSVIFEMRLLGSILDKLISVGVIGFIVLFQSEIRKFLYTIGAHQRLQPLIKLFSGKKGKEPDKKNIMPIVRACMNMARDKVGALIVIERSIPLDDIVETGEIIDAKISNRKSFSTIEVKSLHDGAMIISSKRVKAAGCILEVAHDMDIPKELGLRHRAGLGVTQSSDAMAVIVSEETGRVSVALEGELKLRLSFEELESILTKEMPD